MSIQTEPEVYRATYVHRAPHGCHAVSTVSQEVARRLCEDVESYIEEYEGVYCTGCRARRPIEEFRWLGEDGSSEEVVGS